MMAETASETIWIGSLHLAVYHCGGWAFVYSGRNELIGFAGGERQATAKGLLVSGLVAALELGLRRAAAQSSRSLSIVADRSGRSVLADVFAAAGQTGEAGPSQEDSLLLATILKASAGRRLTLAPARAEASAPMVFISAWAELASGKAKAGPFRAAIPKSNLAKFTTT